MLYKGSDEENGSLIAGRKATEELVFCPANNVNVATVQRRSAFGTLTLAVVADSPVREYYDFDPQRILFKEESIRSSAPLAWAANAKVVRR